MGNLIGLALLAVLVAWIVMLALGSAGVLIGFLPTVLLVLASRILYIFITLGD